MLPICLRASANKRSRFLLSFSRLDLISSTEGRERKLRTDCVGSPVLFVYAGCCGCVTCEGETEGCWAGLGEAKKFAGVVSSIDCCGCCNMEGSPVGLTLLMLPNVGVNGFCSFKSSSATPFGLMNDCCCPPVGRTVAFSHILFGILFTD